MHKLYFTTIPNDAACALFSLSNCIRDIQSWVIVNKLQLNNDKTEFLIASSPHQQKRLNLLTLTINNTTIKPSPTVRNLGVTFDSTMSLTPHVTTTCKSINYHLRNINKIRKYIDKDTCHAAARALVLSRLDYCNSLFNGMKQSDICRLQKLQNNAARMVHTQPKYTHASPLLRQLHWLPVQKRIIFKTAMNMYKALSNAHPQYIVNTLDLSTPNRSGLRSRHNLRIQRTFKHAGDKAFSVAGPRCWNSLPHNIRNSNSLHQFKCKLKSYLFPT